MPAALGVTGWCARDLHAHQSQSRRRSATSWATRRAIRRRRRTCCVSAAALGAGWTTIPPEPSGRSPQTTPSRSKAASSLARPTSSRTWLTNPPLAGLGFAAVRDTAAWIKYDGNAPASAKHAVAFGSSQTGRWLRDFLYEGFNTDERNRQVFDGVIPHLGGGGGVVLDQRWSTPTSLLMESATHFPFADRKQRDPGHRPRGGAAREPAGFGASAQDLLHLSRIPSTGNGASP